MIAKPFEKMGLAELEAELALVIAAEDASGHPDVHSEDYLSELIARAKAPKRFNPAGWVGNADFGLFAEDSIIAAEKHAGIL